MFNSPSTASIRRTLAATALTIAVGALALAQDAPNPFGTTDDPFAKKDSPFEGAAPQAPVNPFDASAPSPSSTQPAPAAPADPDASPFDTSDPFASPGSVTVKPTPAPTPAKTPVPASAPQPAAASTAPPNPFGSATASSAQPNPFGSAPDPFAASNDPFGSTTMTPGSLGGSTTAQNPFVTDSGAEAQSPFGGNIAAPADDPFGSSADPFGAPADPFGGNTPLPTTAAAAPADPFGGGTAASAPADPFGGGTAAAPAMPADPFGGGGAAMAAPADPFGGGTTGAPPDPFGGGSMAAPADPFGGGGTAIAAPADPFGGATAAPADPFGAAAAAPSDPFGGNATADPFGGGAGNQPVVPVFDAARGIAGTFTGDSASGAATTDNPDGISQLYAFRYERTRLWDGTPTVARRKLTAEEAKQYDERVKKYYVDAAAAGTATGFDAASDPNTWAEWAVFSDQLGLWSEYVDNVVLAGFNDGPSAFDQVQWPGQPAADGQDQGPAAALPASGGGAERLVAANQNVSLDDQAGGFFEFNVGGGQNAGIPASTITNQVVAAYDSMLARLRSIESDQEEFMTAFEARLIERNTRRLAYADWQSDREQVLDDFIREWNRRYSGKVSIINGVRYELYRPGEAPEVFPRNTTPVVTDYELTPYDIVNPEDGTLKSSRRD